MKVKLFYACGHDSGLLLIDKNILTFLAWERWKSDTGFDGSKTECFNCFQKRTNSGGKAIYLKGK